MTVIFFSKDEFAKIFTDSEDMILADSDLAHLLGVTIVLNSASQVMSGNCFLWQLETFFL